MWTFIAGAIVVIVLMGLLGGVIEAFKNDPEAAGGCVGMIFLAILGGIIALLLANR